MWISRRCSAPSTGSATAARSRSSGRTPAWTANGARRTPFSSSAAPTSRPLPSPSTRPSNGRNGPHPRPLRPPRGRGGHDWERCVPILVADAPGEATPPPHGGRRGRGWARLPRDAGELLEGVAAVRDEAGADAHRVGHLADVDIA